MSDNVVGITDTAIKILGAISRLGGDDEYKELSVREIASEAGVAWRWVGLRIDALETNDLVKVKRSEATARGKQPHKYRLTKAGVALLERIDSATPVLH